MNWVACPSCGYENLPIRKYCSCCSEPLDAERVVECGGCGRVYSPDFPECPFCYVQEFLEVEAEDGNCPVCKQWVPPIDLGAEHQKFLGKGK